MRFVIDGRLFTLEDLDPEIDDAFVDLHSAYLSNHAYKWEDFDAAALGFFDRAANNASAQDRFFTNFTVIWQYFLSSGRFDEAELVWEMALRPALQWEHQHHERFIHKGTPFYFWGMTAILRGDLDRGYALMHQSVEEDRRTNRVQFPDTPGFALATLNYTKGEQAFRDWVLLQGRGLSEIIATYCNSYGKAFSLDSFRGRFLSNPPSIDTVFLFVYTLARLLHIQRVPPYALLSDFAGQLEINLLFDLTLVIDAAIKARNPNQWRFVEHAVFLSNAASLGIARGELDEINESFKNSPDQTLAAILGSTFRFGNGNHLVGLAADLGIAYGIRNYAAHNVAAAQTIWRQFTEIRQRLFNVLFLTVETLY